MAAGSVRAAAWCRVDLAGGTLDIWPLGLLHGEALTVNVAIDVAVAVELSRRETGYSVRQAGRVHEAESRERLVVDPATSLIGHLAAALDLPPAEIAIESGSPLGGGLGASSALGSAFVAAAEALLGANSRTPRQRVELVRDVEAQLMGLPTGIQDHWAAELGGALAIHHRLGGAVVRRLEVDLEALSNSLLVVYTGQSHFSAGSNWQVVRRRLDGDAESRALFDGIASIAAEVRDALEAGALRQVGRLLSAEWGLRSRLAPEVSNPAIDRLLAAASEAGAWGGKACGAGGGGCLAILAPPDRRQELLATLKTGGGTPVAARCATGRLRVERAT